MCGIAGLLRSQYSPDASLQIARKMGNAIAHRGPDDHGVWSDSKGNYLVHQRLSILDISAAGHQPMVSHNGRFIIVFNGEIYNYKELHQRLTSQGLHFRGSSDTEVLLELISLQGLEKTLPEIKGMFAIAVLDQETQKLWLARDRMGEKPLYYAWHKGQLLFSSELKSLREVPDFSPRIDQTSLGLFFKYNYIRAPYCIYEGVFKLPQSSYAEIDLHTQKMKIASYWTYPPPLTIEQDEAFSEPYESTVEKFHLLLKKCVSQQMHSDVPLGSFLSGGLDSSLITAVMQAQSQQPVRTFTIGFEEKAFDESPYAREIADHLQCQHTDWILSSREIKSLIPEIPRIYDEPFSDSSQLPTCLLAKMTRQKVTVALSGDGGDELFGGYNRYLWMEKIWKSVNPLPLWLRNLCSQTLDSRSEESWQESYDFFSKLFPIPKVDGFGHKMEKLSKVLSASNSLEAYDLLLSHWHQPQKILSSAFKAPSIMTPLSDRSLISNMMWMDSQTYLPDDLMVKVDRATMAVSLESRAPFLDHELIEFVSALPLRYKVQNQRSKRLLRSVLNKYVPEALLDRPKKGFSVPISLWLRGDLKAWAEDLLSRENLSHGYLNTDQIQRCWKEHLSGKKNWGLLLWDILVFQMWYHHHHKTKNT